MLLTPVPRLGAAAHGLLSPLPSGDVIEVYYGDNRFGTVTDSGTATLKPRPRVRPLLTFLPLVSAQSGAGAVPRSSCCPALPEGGQNWKAEPLCTEAGHQGLGGDLSSRWSDTAQALGGEA